MKNKNFDPTEKIKLLKGKQLGSISRYGYLGSDEGRTGIDPILLETNEQSFYITTDEGKGNILIYDFDSLPKTALKGRIRVDVDLFDVLPKSDNENEQPKITRVEKIGRADEQYPYLYNFCGAKLTFENEHALYIGTHIREWIDTDDLCILTEDEIRKDLIFSEL